MIKHPNFRIGFTPKSTNANDFTLDSISRYALTIVDDKDEVMITYAESLQRPVVWNVLNYNKDTTTYMWIANDTPDVKIQMKLVSFKRQFNCSEDTTEPVIITAKFNKVK